jgi:ATP-dependent DNA helicase DinG
MFGKDGSMRFAVIDFETTGDHSGDEIIQIGLVMIEDEVITDQYSTLVKPNRTIPEFITQLTGISDEMVEHAPELEEAMIGLLPFLADSVLVAHNAAFDLGFLQRALAACGYKPFGGRVLDSIDLLRIMFPALPSLQLSMAASSLGIKHERPHQADSDAEVTAELWLRCLHRLKEMPLLVHQRLAAIFQYEISDLAWFLQDSCRNRELSTALDDPSVKAFRQFALNVEDWGEEDDEDGWPPDLPGAYDSFYDSVKEALRQRNEAFEERPAQNQMSTEVHSALEQGKHLMIEAGTGTGKSLGYLIPSLYYGLQEEKKVVVSTHTINLQEQLRHRDIPLLQEIIPVPFKTAVLKGRSHYLCLRKFETKLNAHDYSHPKEDLITAGQMTVWLKETEHGEDEELQFGPKGSSFWHSVASDTDSCLNRSCPWYKKCFYHRARHQANQAQVVITNHSLLFTDIKADNRLLPSYKHLVIDEAHHFEEVASSHLGISIFYNSIANSLLWLLRDSRNGLLPQLRIRLEKTGSERAVSWCGRIEQLYPMLVKIKEAWDSMTEQMYELTAQGSDASSSDFGQVVLRLKKDQLPSRWGEIKLAAENVILELTDFLRKLDALLAECKEEAEEYGIQGMLTDLTGNYNELCRYRDDLRFFIEMSDNNYVYWLEAGTYNKAKSLMMTAVPIDVSELLQDQVFSQKDSVVMTSATLSVNKSFQYVSDQLGLNTDLQEGRLKTLQLDSHFNYREQALVLIPRDFPSIRGAGGEREFTAALIRSLRDVALETKGRMLALFTSNRMLKMAHQALKEELYPHGIQVLGQGVDSSNRSKLTRTFLNSESAVLLGTSSFWEGVDIPGDALSCLAIVRLPFQPPNHPFIEAKCDLLKSQGHNPFMKFSVPQAVIRFKQGFGRLIRTSTDKGIVLIYDTRVIDTPYGKYFIYSLPGPKIELLTTPGLVPRIQEWMGAKTP